MTLKSVNSKYVKAAERALALRDERDREIVAAVKAGAKPAAVAREIGLTRGRVWQILERAGVEEK